MMKVLLYQWKSNQDPIFEQALRSVEGTEVLTFDRKPTDYHFDAEFSKELFEVIHKEQIELVFSIDYYPIISLICDVVKIKYVSWIVDCPMLTLQSKTVSNECNYIFNFDRLYTQKIADLGCKHSIYMPLGGAEGLTRALNVPKNQECPQIDSNSPFYSDISFVGSMYTDKKNRYRKANLDEYTKGFVDGLINAQEKVYGYNFLKESLPDDVCMSYAKECELSLSDMYFEDIPQLVSDSLSVETTAREREHVLNMLSDNWDVSLHTDCELPDFLTKPGLHNKGRVKYETEMPLVFRDSRINLNITSKSIESGIPLRVFDILACGGFCMTNYQIEIAEMFEDGVDLVMYSSLDDLKAKTAYYLAHEEERAEIARNGYRKVFKKYNMKDAIADILKMTEHE